MLPAERQKEILELVRKDKVASVTKLAERFDVHPATIRRDLAEIEEKGLLKRTHGGVIEDDTASEPPFSERAREQFQEKERIGQRAAEIVADGEHIIIDSGTTTLHIARNLRNRKGLTVVTNDMNVASELRDAPGVKVIVTGGILYQGSYMLNGMFTDQMLQSIHVQKAFIGTPAIHPAHGLTHPDLELVPTKKWMIKAAQQIIVTTDHTKIGKVSLHTVAPIRDIHTFITGKEAFEPQVRKFIDSGVHVETV